MKAFKVVLTFLFAFFFILTSTLQANDDASDQQPATSIYELISMTDQLSMLKDAVDVAGLAEMLNEQEALTVFLPVNDAFEALPEATLDAYMEDQEALQTLLTNHFVEGEVRSGQLNDGESMEMMSGNPAEISISGAGLEIEGANIIQVDVEASNGIIHVVSSLVMPDE